MSWRFLSSLRAPLSGFPRSSSRTYSSKSDLISSSSNLPKPRIDYKAIAENVTLKSHNAFNRNVSLPIGSIQSIGRLYAEQKELSTTLNAKRHAQSTVGQYIRANAADPEARKAALEDAKLLKAEVTELEHQLFQLEDQLLALALAVPNDTHPLSPLGDEAAAVTLSTHGPSPVPASSARDHVSIARSLHLIDLEAGSTVTGSSWYYLLNEAVLLEMALVNYAMSIAVARGFSPVTTPDVVRLDVARRCGFNPRDPQSSLSQMYHISHHLVSGHDDSYPELVLSGTAEIPLAGMFANKVFLPQQLPMRVVGLGKAFRAEAGARGADTRGLYRVHQFTKLELFAVTVQEDSEEMMEEMRRLQVEVFEGLGLSFRVLDMPTQELGASAYRKYDMEAWMPGRGSWGEISSTSNCTDYQARRLHIRYRPQSDHSPTSTPLQSTESTTHLTAKTLPFVHTLNGTAVAVPRLLVALLENGVRFDDVGNVIGLDLPSVLKPYWFGGSGRDIIQWV